jgi:hypothetical protein
MVKVIYYVWAFAGGYLYFSEVRHNEESELKRLKTTLLVLTIVNIVDILRFLMIIALLVGIHVICKRRVRNQARSANGLAYET